jgi:hypothetical protein
MERIFNHKDTKGMKANAPLLGERAGVREVVETTDFFVASCLGGSFPLSGCVLVMCPFTNISRRRNEKIRMTKE